MLETRRGPLFAVLAAACVLAGAVTIAIGLRARDSLATAASPGATVALAAARAAKRPTVVFRDAAHHGQLAIAAAGRPSAAPTPSALRCDRVYFAAGRGHLPGPRRLPGAATRPRSSAPTCASAHSLPGRPGYRAARGSRRTAATARSTTLRHRPLVRGGGQFSTQTTIIDLAAGRGDRRPRAVHRRRATAGRSTAVDFNFWGVTFARDSDRFYATLATGGKTYLSQGSRRRAHGARDPRERRVPVALARRDADRLQAAHRVQRAPVAADRARPRHDARDAAGRATLRRRPGRVARRRPRALRRSTARCGRPAPTGPGRRALHRRRGLAGRRCAGDAGDIVALSRPSASTPTGPGGDDRSLDRGSPDHPCPRGDDRRARGLPGGRHGRVRQPGRLREREGRAAPSAWQIVGAGDSTIQGYATSMSVNKGETVGFKIKTTALARTTSTSSASATTRATAPRLQQRTSGRRATLPADAARVSRRPRRPG